MYRKLQVERFIDYREADGSLSLVVAAGDLKLQIYYLLLIKNNVSWKR